MWVEHCNPVYSLLSESPLMLQRYRKPFRYSYCDMYCWYFNNFSISCSPNMGSVVALFSSSSAFLRCLLSWPSLSQCFKQCSLRRKGSEQLCAFDFMQPSSHVGMNVFMRQVYMNDTSMISDTSSVILFSEKHWFTFKLWTKLLFVLVSCNCEYWLCNLVCAFCVLLMRNSYKAC